MKINDVTGLLTSAYTEWSEWLQNPRFIRSDSEITWSGSDRAKQFDPLVPDDLHLLIANRQYTFTTYDGGMLQIHYRFDKAGSALLGARLAFYKPVVAIHDVSFRPSWKKNDPRQQATERVESFRIDFDLTYSKPVLHPACHVQIAAFPMARFATHSVPDPRQFIEFVFASFYPEIYADYRLRDLAEYANVCKKINGPPICSEQTPLTILHFRLPTS